MNLKKTVSIIIFFILTSCVTKDAYKELLGKYEITGWGGSRKLFLDEFGKFHSEEAHVSCLGSDWIDIVEGDYFLQQNYVILKPLSFHHQYYEYDKPSDRKLVWDSARSVKSLNDFYDSLIYISLNQKLFLLGANKTTVNNSDEFISGGITHFLNWVNSKDTVSFQTHFLSKQCLSCKEQDLKKALPKEWSDYLISTEIKGKVISVDSIKSKLNENITFTHPYFTIDVENQKIYPGYQFYSDSFESITILEVNGNLCKGVSYRDGLTKIRLGDVLSTLKPKKADNFSSAN